MRQTRLTKTVASTAATARAALPQALRDPAVYSHAADRLELVETHVSWILLAGEYAYKFKRPVVLPFLDYGTPERRRAACATEVAINRRWAPELYLGVSELVVTRDGLRLDAAGRPLEPCVRMRRFDRRLELDRLLQSGAVEPGELAMLGADVARWQDEAPAAAIDSRPVAPDETLARTAETLAMLAATCPADVRPLLAAIESRAAQQQQVLRAALERRQRAGRVRECHGDLHCGNIVRLGGRLTPFDAIDFDPRLRSIDVASDVAFLTADLTRRGRADLAAVFLDGWLASGGDYDAGHVLRWFLADRALVRAKVAALRAAELKAGTAGAAALADARAYLGTALAVLRRPPGRLILTFGPSGSGKSWLAGRLVAALPAIRVRADLERKRLAGFAPLASSGSPPAAGLYTAEATARTYRQLALATASLVEAGIDVIADASFLDAARRREFAALAAAHHAPFAILECSAPAELLRERLMRRRGDPSEATVAILERQLAAAATLSADERRATLTVDTSASVDVEALAAALRGVAARPAG